MRIPCRDGRPSCSTWLALLVTTFGAFAALVLLGCPRETPDEPIVGRFGNRTITRRAFTEYVQATGPGAVARAQTLVGRRALLRAMIDEEIQVAEAEKRRLRHDREVRDAVTPLLAKRLLDAELEARLSPADVPEEEVRALYQARHDDFHQPPRWRFGVIHTASLQKARALRAELALVHDDEEIFEVLAGSEENVEEPLRAAAGSFGYFTIERMQQELPEDLWPHFDRMKERVEVPEIVETPRGAFVLMVTGHQARMEATYESVEPSLREEAFAGYRTRKIEEFVRTFRGSHRVTVNAGLLDRVRVLP